MADILGNLLNIQCAKQLVDHRGRFARLASASGWKVLSSYPLRMPVKTVVFTEDCAHAGILDVSRNGFTVPWEPPAFECSALEIMTAISALVMT